jgi:N-acetylglucosamine-6-sulfatase
MTLALRRPVLLQLLQLLLLLLGLDRAVDASKPNFVIFLQDDQDFLNGRDGLRPMTKTLELIADKGILAENWFIHTPVCCPSRAELLSGRYFHNLRMPNGTGGGCMHVQTGVAGMEDKPNEHSFAKYLVQERGYTAAWFGKHLNSMNGRHPPPPGYGCKTCHWFTNGGGSDTEPGGYYMPSFSDFYGGVPTAVNGTFSKNGSWSSWGPGAPVTADGMRVPAYGGYWTSIVGNMSIDWLHKIAGPTVERDAEGYLTTPFVLTVAPKAP